MIRGDGPFREPGRHVVHPSGNGPASQEPASVTASEQYAGMSLRLQVLEIINSVLNSTGPELEGVRIRLQRHVKEHPWNPETALLHHLRDRERHLAAPHEVDITPGQPPDGNSLPALRPGPPPDDMSGGGLRPG
ncbi:hypothetical protein [Pseudarthrobacter albicanus]|uniref:hypothetical protein n=1 Tax=Pseudarthrobacter albicanus TaxID=2823873 RepID=UPI001BA7C8F4|nr:hypothetical protein [Pseudarthrobacter albicanus]